MRVKIYSRKKLKDLLKKGAIENTAIISFCDPQEAPLDLEGKCSDYIIIKIHDLDPEALEKFGYTMETYFDKAKENGYDIICQCEYGQSRSAGCAGAILEHFSRSGIKVFADYRYYPNQLIFNKTLQALTNYKKTQK